MAFYTKINPKFAFVLCLFVQVHSQWPHELLLNHCVHKFETNKKFSVYKIKVRVKENKGKSKGATPFVATSLDKSRVDHMASQIP